MHYTLAITDPELISAINEHLVDLRKKGWSMGLPEGEHDPYTLYRDVVKSQGTLLEGSAFDGSAEEFEDRIVQLFGPDLSANLKQHYSQLLATLLKNMLQAKLSEGMLVTEHDYTNNIYLDNRV